MKKHNLFSGLLKEVLNLLILLISMSGYVPKNSTLSRAAVMTVSLGFVIFINFLQPGNYSIAFSYFVLSEIGYLGFITVVLSENGLRHRFIKKWGSENNGYLAFEAILGFLFFHNAASIAYIASASRGTLFTVHDNSFLFVLTGIMFITGFSVKVLAAKAVSIEIYYWKDMFLGKKISDFVVTGPYKYLSNPMYGVGQLPAYASALWSGSKPGLIAAMINQILIFSFYFLVEKKFIDRVYKNYSKD